MPSRRRPENFGSAWQTFDAVEAHHESQFQDWIAPATPDFVRGRIVLEAGCGKGRDTTALARWGARDLVGVDISRAADVAYRNTRALPNAHVVQADIDRLPFRDPFDYVLSVGVLHHLPIRARGSCAWCVTYVRVGPYRSGSTVERTTAGSCTSSFRYGGQ